MLSFLNNYKNIIIVTITVIELVCFSLLLLGDMKIITTPHLISKNFTGILIMYMLVLTYLVTPTHVK
ncbi:hypothetical protein JOD28_001763 [Leuconostoc rapi]|nr:hypothetical protein [Leuconostoc rapi]